MPIYEFECRKCNAHIEVFQKMSDKPPVKCRKCGGRLERKLSAPAIQFKGSGWYVTDYAKKSESAKPDGKAGASETSKDGASGAESKEASASKDSKEKAGGADTTSGSKTSARDSNSKTSKTE